MILYDLPYSSSEIFLDGLKRELHIWSTGLNKEVRRSDYYWNNLYFLLHWLCITQAVSKWDSPKFILSYILDWKLEQERKFYINQRTEITTKKLEMRGWQLERSYHAPGMQFFLQHIHQLLYLFKLVFRNLKFVITLSGKRDLFL